MDYLLPGRLARVMNKRYVKLGSRAFYINHVKLSAEDNKKAVKLNLLYYNAYLVSLVYSAYRHLFGLDNKMKKTLRPAYWYNSIQAMEFIKVFKELMKNGINPVDFLSYRFSSFRYQYDTYRHIYSFTSNGLVFSRVIQNYLAKIYYGSRYAQNFRCYFLGVPILDLLYRYFDFCFITDNPFLLTIKDIKRKWSNYIIEARNSLRSSKLGFYLKFHHYPDSYENSLRFNSDLHSIFLLLGVPEDFKAFGFSSNQLYYWTHGFTTNLNGYINKRNNSLDIRGQQLYSIDVARRELQNYYDLTRHLA